VTIMKANLLIPMAGAGKRFSDAGYTIHKSFLPLGKDTMIEAVIKNLYHPDLHFIFVASSKTIDTAELKQKVAKHLKDFDFLEVDYLPQGSAMTCLVARDLIDNATPLITADCDAIIEDWNYDYFKNFCDFHNPDGVIGTFFSVNPKNSYVRIDGEGRIIETKEKQVIGNMATNGLRYWKNGKMFVAAVEEMIKNNDMTNGEYYVAPSFNYMLKEGMRVLPYHFNMHFPTGIPEDYENYRKWRNL